MDWMQPMLKKWFAVTAGVVIVLAAVAQPDVRSYLQEKKAELAVSYAYQSGVEDKAANDPLMSRIKEEAAKRYIAPINARIDRVWKAIPGYNGLEVDIERTYTVNSGKDHSAELKMVMREVKPEVSLTSLDPQPIYRGNSNKPMAALMINVAWGNEYIDPMLKVLADEKVQATFFLDGSWLKENPDIAKRIQAAGHEMENHAYSHPNMSELSEGHQTQQIEKTKQLLKQTLGVENKWFAPPSGDFNMLTVRTAHALGLKTVLWTFDTRDWMKPSVATILRRFQEKTEPGSLILMHPTEPSSTALKEMIRILKQKGIVPGTVGETLSEKRMPPIEVER